MTDSGRSGSNFNDLEEVKGDNRNSKNGKGQTRLHMAVLRGNLDRVREIIKSGDSVARTDHQGMTPLHYCAQHIHKTYELVELLVNAGGSVRERDQYGRSVFALLCCGPSRESFEYLLKICPSVPQAPDVNGWKPLNFASAGGGFGVLSLTSPLDYQLNEDIEEVKSRMRELLKEAQVGKLLDKSSKSESQKSLSAALHLASGLDNLEMVQWLILIAGVDVNSRDDHGWTPLTISATLPRASLATFLLNIASADPHLRGPKGLTPLHIAVSTGNAKTVEEIVKFQTDIDALDDFKRSALHYAAAQGNMEIYNALVEAGANAELKDARGWTPNQLLPKSFWQTWCSIS